MLVRKAVVAGYFYPSNSKRLLSELNEYMTDEEKFDAKGAICPHAGYIYSGATAGAVYSRLIPKDLYVLLGPNHTGYGADISVMSEGEWEIPLGRFRVDETVAKKIIEKLSGVRSDIKAHLYEHSLEVQLPFIYKLNPNAKIVPVVLKTISINDCSMFAQVLAETLLELNLQQKVTVIASTDMSHYLPDDLARKVDTLAIEKIQKFDPQGLYATVVENNISMCGFIPTVTMLFATRILGAKEVKIIKYTTSAEVSRDYDKVVGYLGALVI
ncbi:MAG: AmmeMemoRadiSam system protein B [Thermodesulfovibrionaceae bacterium]